MDGDICDDDDNIVGKYVNGKPNFLSNIYQNDNRLIYVLLNFIYLIFSITHMYR